VTHPVLRGIRIVDATTGLAGPVATRLLAEVGAEVIKIEPPAGDPVRKKQPAAFATWNRSKRGAVIDLTTPEGIASLYELLAEADVFVHELTPQRAAAVGLDDASLTRRYPQLVVTAVTAYPADHVDAERTDDELLVQARSGIMDEQLGHRPGPVVLRFPIANWPTAYLAAVGIVVRLMVRSATGRAGIAHTSLFQGLMAELAIVWHRAERPSDQMRVKIPLPRDRAFPAITLFECGDGIWIQTLGGFMENPLVIETIAMLGEEYIVVPFGALPTPEQREVWVRMFRSRPSSEWITAFNEGDVPAELVRSLGEILLDPGSKLNGYVVELDDPVWGHVVQAATPFHLTPAASVSGPAPALDGPSATTWEGSHVAASGADPYPAQPLAGLKVLDLGMFLAGPFAPMLLADLGADVIKLEPPTGDRMRTSELMFVACQRGKRSVALDLRAPEGREAFEALVRWADVVHHNLRMPAARTLGVDEESLRKINPDLIYCHVSSYGTTGPRADWPGYDPVAQAASGFMLEGAGEGNPPMWTRFGMMDHQAALSSLLPTLLALFHFRETGKAGRVDASLLGAAAMVNSETMVLTDGTFADVPHLDRDQRLLAPGRGIYQAADGWLAVSVRDDDELVRMLSGVGAGDHAAFEDEIGGRLRDEALAALECAGVPCAPVHLDHEQAYFDDALLRERGYTVAYEHPVYGRLEQPGATWDFGDLELTMQRPPPVLGQHSLEVLREVGVSDEQIAALLTTSALIVPESQGAE
jgi:crotonobetainyl-CoA:carnitine CoA-transferase CaiB-like acyl-CoA transferase